MRQAAIAEVDALESHDEKLRGIGYDLNLQISALERLVGTNQRICTDGFETMERKLDEVLKAQAKLAKLVEQALHKGNGRDHAEAD
jgi:hypothetical protein